MAKRTFEFTLQTLEGLDLEKFGCTSAELAEWRRMAEQMFIPYDAKTGIFEQHEGFFNLPHLDVDAIPVEDFPLYHHWSYDRIYRNDMIKQPDVLMFMFLYNQSFTLAEKQANYDYYEPRCIHEFSLSPSVHSIFAAELGRPQEAFDFFRFATRIDLDNYNRNTARRHPHHFHRRGVDEHRLRLWRDALRWGDAVLQPHHPRPLEGLQLPGALPRLGHPGGSLAA